MTKEKGETMKDKNFESFDALRERERERASI